MSAIIFVDHRITYCLGSFFRRLSCLSFYDCRYLLFRLSYLDMGESRQQFLQKQWQERKLYNLYTIFQQEGRDKIRGAVSTVKDMLIRMLCTFAGFVSGVLMLRMYYLMIF